MRCLHEAAVVLLVVDDLTGQPLPDAAVFCTTVGRGGVRNASGFHVFSDLPPGAYEFVVQHPGYGVCRVNLSRPGALCCACTVRLPYSQSHPRLGGRRHLLFRLSDGAGPLAGQQAAIRLESPSPPLRVVEDADKGAVLLALNGPPGPELLARELADGVGGPVVLAGLAPEARAYQLDRPLEGAVRSGSRMRPVWRFETDREGAAVLPIQPLLMPEGALSFTVSCGGRERQAQVEPFLENERRVDVLF